MICRKPRRAWVHTQVCLLLTWPIQSLATYHCQTWQPTCTYTKLQLQKPRGTCCGVAPAMVQKKKKATSTGTKSAGYFVSCFWAMESNQESTSGFLWMKNESGITSEKTSPAPAGSAITSLSSAHLAGEYRSDGEAEDNSFLQRNSNYF